MRYDVDAVEDLKLIEDQLDELRRTVNSRARERGFVPFARPKVPDVVKPLLECMHEGERIFLSDPRLEGEVLEDLELVPPADVSKLDPESVGHLIQYLTAELARKAVELNDLQYEKDAAKTKHRRLIRMVSLDLQNKKDPETGKKYTQKAIGDKSKVDRRVVQYEEVYEMARAIYNRAQAIYDGWKRVIEALNRSRMAKSEELQRTYTEPEFADQRKAYRKASLKKARRRWQTKSRGSYE